ncbi:MAG TPA: HAD-IA family hydrolase [Pyrinomonadaceae bacterium]|nr:HAD-IA family hydrolase [Pyrinomonadaceae bacterium]
MFSIDVMLPVETKTASVTTLLFDWDGTLVDSAQLGLTAFERSFAALGLDFDHDVYQTVYSPNWYSVYEAMGLPKEKWELADDLWIQHYGEQVAQPVAGATETIAELKRRGYRMGVVSSGSDCRVKREISELGLVDFFETTVCSEQMKNKKPHPEGLHSALGVLDCPAESSCYVGDSPEDIEMGKRAGMLTIGVRSAYPTSWKLKSSAPDIYLESLAELPSYFPPR